MEQKRIIILGSVGAVLIVGVIAAIVLTNRPASETVPALGETPDAATTQQSDAEKRDLQRYRDITALRIALNGYSGSQGSYPASLAELVPDFITAVPADPDGSAYAYTAADGAFTLSFTLEQGAISLPAGEHFLTPRGFDLEAVAMPAQPATPTISTTLPPTEKTLAEANGEASVLDTDDDGLSDAEESVLGTDPEKADSDRDGLADGIEVRTLSTDPLNADSDGDGFSDGDELYSGFDPMSSGGMLVDSDKDGLADIYEELNDMNPTDADMDNDGIADGDELRVFATDPRKADSDGDGYADREELSAGYEPSGPDKLSSARAMAVSAAAERYGIHAPTDATLVP